MDSNSRVFRETKYGICFDIKRKNSTLTPSEKSEIYRVFHRTRSLKVFLEGFEKKYLTLTYLCFGICSF